MKLNAFTSMRLAAQELLRISPLDAWREHPIEAVETVMTSRLLPFFPRQDVDDDKSLSRSARLTLLVAGMWNVCRRPVVTLGHQTAAALMATRIHPDAAELVRPPWPAFLVRLPTPLLTIDDVDEAAQPASLLMAVCLPKRFIDDVSPRPGRPDSLRWFYKLCADVPPKHQGLALEMHAELGPLFAFGVGVSLWGFNQDSVDMVSARGSDDGWTLWDQLEASDTDTRTDLLAKSLVLNVSQYCELPNATAERHSPAKLHTRPSKPDRLDGYMECQLELTTPGIKLNLVEAVKEYARTGCTPTAYSSWVQPHWKRVVYGEHRALRRLQYIDSYLRGARECGKQ